MGKLFESKRNSHILFFIMIFVNVLIPKAGIKINGIPLTLGSVLLGILSIIFLLSIIKNEKILFDFFCKIIIGGVLFWILRFSYSIINNSSLLSADSFAFIISLIVCPLTFFVFQKNVEDEDVLLDIIRIIDFCLVVTMVYSIIQLVFGVEKTAIPGVTVNLTDYLNSPNGWWREKNNYVGEINTKIMSTYQNGNVYGANLLLFFPLINKTPRENKSVKLIYFILFFICAILTGSRTVFFGLISYLLLILFFWIKRTKRVKISINFFLILLSITIFVFFMYYFYIPTTNDYIIRIKNSLNWETLINASGRTGNFMNYLQWMSGSRNSVFAIVLGSFGLNYRGSSYEMLFFTVFMLGGFIGFLFFCAPFFLLLRISLKKIKNKNNWIISGVTESLVVYFIASFIDGSFWLMPTPINVWILFSIGYWEIQSLNHNAIKKTLSSNLNIKNINNE